MQIAEPGESRAKDACKKRVVGIDLGTTNSLVAHVADGGPVVISGKTGPLVPSVVYYAPDRSGVLVGHAALARGLDGAGLPRPGSAAEGQRGSIEEPGNTVASAKRLIGRALADVAGMRAMLPYAIAGDARAVRIVLARGDEVSPVEVSAEILRELAARAEASLGGPIEGAVITVPAYFDDAQRQATRDAGRLAGLEVLRLLAEPTAAALAYGLDRGSRGTYAVFDLGGGTFDVSILKLVDGVFEVKATGGDSALGGDDLDRTIAVAVRGDLGGELRDVAAALAEARRVKEALTDGDAVQFHVPGLGGRRVTREELRVWAQPLLEKCGKACRRVLKDAGVTREELDGVILVGGSTRSPVVRAYVRELFGREPLSDLDPDEVVALGAAVQADVLAGGKQDVVLLDVVPLSLGLEMMGGVVEKLIHRNTTIPCGATETFTTYADNQTGFDVHVLQGERETADACRSLARFVVRGVPPMIAGMGRVEITFAVDADGLLHVTAKELTTGVVTSVNVKPSYGLTDEEVERMLMESFDHAEDDLARRNLAVERVEAERILAATRGAFANPDGMLDDDVRAAGEGAMAVLAAAMAGTDHHAIRAAVEALDLATKPFAQARMNRAIGAQLEGKSLADAERSLTK